MGDSIRMDPEPIHRWFGLSYSNYLVLPRSVLQSMPVEWQARFVACLEEAREVCAPLNMNDEYSVLLRGERGRIVRDPYADYQRGRRDVFRESGVSIPITDGDGDP